MPGDGVLPGRREHVRNRITLLVSKVPSTLMIDEPMYREADSVSGTAWPSPARALAPLAAGATILLSAWAAPPGAAAQPGPGELGGEAAALGVTLGGSDFDNVGVGYGGEVGLRYGLTPRLSLGLAGHGSWHSTSGLDDPLRLVGLFLEPRYAFGSPGGGIRPFVGLRVGAARWSASRSTDSLAADVRADGLQAGGTAGVAYPLTGSLTLEAAAVASFLSFGDARVDAALGGSDYTPFVPGGTSTSGALLGLRTLLRLRVP